MRILMLSGGYPIPADNGAKRRILAGTSYMSQHHDLMLVSLREQSTSMISHAESNDVPWKEYVFELPVKRRSHIALKALFARRSYGQVKYWNRNFQSVVERMLTIEYFDCIWVHQLNMVPYLERCFFNSKWGQKQSLPMFVLDQQNVDELYFGSFLGREVDTAWRLYAMLEVAKARRIQKRWFPRFDAILCVSPEDLQKSGEYSDASTSLWLAPNGVDIEYFQPVPQQDLRERTSILVFGGSLDVTMNQDAVHWFSSSILPLIRQRIPNVQFCIVGRNPPSEIQSLAERPGIKITGTVKDVRDYYRQSAVFVVPLRIGGGTKLKTLEGMAMGLPVVSTTVGSQGLDVESGRHLYIADSPEDFTTHTVELLKDRDKAVSIGAEARLLVEQKYGWTSIMSDVDRKLTALFWKRESQRG